MLEISQLLVFHLTYFMIAREDSPFSQNINQTNGTEIQYIIVCSIVPDVFSLFLVSSAGTLYQGSQNYNVFEIWNI